MNIKRSIIVVAALCCLVVKPALAQLPAESKYENRLIFLAQVDEDLLKRVIRYDNKYMYCSFGEGMKLHDPFGQSNFYFASLASSYRFHKYFKVGGSYYGMTVRASKTGEWRWSHRFNADLNFKYKTGNWQFSARDREWDITDMGEIWAGIETESVPALGVRVKYMF